MKGVILRRAWSCWSVTLLVWAMALAGLSACSAGVEPDRPTPIAQEATRTPSPAPTATVSPTPCPVVPSATPGAKATATATRWPWWSPPPTITPLPTRPRTATKLHLTAKDTEGQTVSITKAELILVEHRHVGRLKLEPSDDQLTLTLDEDWLRSRWNDSTFQVADDDIPVSSFESMECVYLYIQADGYAPVRSAPFLWIGARRRVSQVEIEFPNNSSMTLPEGSQGEFTFTMRKPQARYLRFVDDDRNPVQGVHVASYVFWGLIGHCGWTGGDLLAESDSDEQGRARVPDGDVEYAFHFEKPGHICMKCELEFFPMRLITYLKADETVVDLHQWQRWPIRILATRGGEPAADETLIGLYVACPCFTCSRRLGTTDSDGMIVLSDFYPEEWKTIFFADSSGNRVWQRDLRLSRPAGVIHAELPVITPTTEGN